MADEANDLSGIERHMNAVTAVHKVVHAIWALSRAQLPLVEAAVEQATQYFDWIDEIVAALAGAPRRQNKRNVLLVVMGPERPYCGAMPRQIVDQLVERIAELSESRSTTGLRLGIVGMRLAETAAQEPKIAPHVAFTLPAATTHEDHEDVARATAEAILKHAGASDVELYHPHDGTSVLHHITLLAGEREPASCPPETFSPLRTVIDMAASEAITGRLAIGVAEALRSEVRARIATADAARRAADEKLESLRKDWAVARQDQITAELMEIVAGRQATIGHRRPS